MILRTLAIAVTALFVAVAAQAQQAPQREITNIAGDLYR